mgnify:CR=1 FL=1
MTDDNEEDTRLTKIETLINAFKVIFVTIGLSAFLGGMAVRDATKENTLRVAALERALTDGRGREQAMLDLTLSIRELKATMESQSGSIQRQMGDLLRRIERLEGNPGR